jgi:ferredoxin
MSLEVDRNVCDQCGTCICVCSTDALLLQDTIIVDHKKCVMCKKCIRICPVGALSEN